MLHSKCNNDRQQLDKFRHEFCIAIGCAKRQQRSLTNPYRSTLLTNRSQSLTTNSSQQRRTRSGITNGTTASSSISYNTNNECIQFSPIAPTEQGWNYKWFDIVMEFYLGENLPAGDGGGGRQCKVMISVHIFLWFLWKYWWLYSRKSLFQYILKLIRFVIN